MEKIVNRNNFIVERCRNKRVVDVACVCHDLSESQIDRGIWLHHNISEVAKSVIGYDIVDQETIDNLCKKGYNIVKCDAENLPKHHDIDVIVMGSCIEHFLNPGFVLDRIKDNCNENTEVIISTINSWAIRYFVSAMINNEARTCRDDHVCWYSHYVLENLLRLKGFKVIEKHYYNFYPEKHKGIRPFFRRLQKKLMPFTSHGIICIGKIS